MTLAKQFSQKRSTQISGLVCDSRVPVPTREASRGRVLRGGVCDEVGLADFTRSDASLSLGSRPQATRPAPIELAWGRSETDSVGSSASAGWSRFERGIYLYLRIQLLAKLLSD